MEKNTLVTKPRVSDTRRLKNFLRWSDLQFSFDPKETTFTISSIRRKAREKMRSSVRKFFDGNRYPAKILIDGGELPYKTGQKLLHAFRDIGLTEEILEHPQLERYNYCCGINVEFIGNTTIDEFVNKVFEKILPIECMFPCLGEFDVVMFSYSTMAEHNRIIWKDLRSIDKNVIIKSTTTLLAYQGQVKHRFNPEEHPRFLEMKKNRTEWSKCHSS